MSNTRRCAAEITATMLAICATQAGGSRLYSSMTGTTPHSKLSDLLAVTANAVAASIVGETIKRSKVREATLTLACYDLPGVRDDAEAWDDASKRRRAPSALCRAAR